MMFSDDALVAAIEYADRACGYNQPDPRRDVPLVKRILSGEPFVLVEWSNHVREFLNGTARLSTISEYERAVMVLAFYHGRGKGELTYPILGICEEAGEVAGHLKKAMRDDRSSPNRDGLSVERKDAIVKELGDVLWYITATAQELGLSLQDIAQTNYKKLYDRAGRGALGGSGDSR